MFQSVDDSFQKFKIKQFIQKFVNDSSRNSIIGRFIQKFKNQTIHFVSFLYKKKRIDYLQKIADSLQTNYDSKSKKLFGINIIYL